MSGISPNAMVLLLDYGWPGNVRELENVIQSAIILSDGDTMQPRDLPKAMQHVELLGFGNSLPGGSFEEQMQDFKIKLAYKAIQECKGNKTMAARSLNISRTYLHRLIKAPEDNDSEDGSLETELVSGAKFSFPRANRLPDGRGSE